MHSLLRTPTFPGAFSVSFVNVKVARRLREEEQRHKLQDGRNTTDS